MTTRPPSQVLQQVASEKLRAERIRLGMEVGIFAVLALMVPMLLDYIYFWPLVARCVAEVVWITSVVLVYRAAVWQWRRWENAKAVALELEGQHPHTRCEISTSAELATRPESGSLHAELAEALHRRSDYHLRNIAPPYRRHIQTWVVVAGVEALLFVLLLASFPSGRLAVLRVTLPWTVPTYTVITAKPGDTQVAMTEDLDVVATFLGRTPDQSQIEWRGKSGDWQKTGMTFTAEDAASFTFKNVQEDFTYRIVANDGISPEYHVVVYPTPDVAKWEIDAVPPAYSKLPEQHVADGDVATLRGSGLTWHLVPTRPLAQASLHFEKDLADIALTGSANDWTGKLTLKKSAEYRALLTDVEHHANLHPSLHHLVAIPDAPPQVAITSPEEIHVADPGDVVPITIEAQDDLGLASVALHYRQPGHPVQDVELWPAGQEGRTFSVSSSIALAPLNLKPYDIVVYYADAKDNNTYDGPGVGKSRIQIIVIRGPKKEPQNTPPSSGGGTKIDLTQLEQALMDATAMMKMSGQSPGQEKDNASGQDLASQQEQIRQLAIEGGKDTPEVSGNPQVAAQLQVAISDMGQAENSLKAGDQPGALDGEGQALAVLMQISQYLPEEAGGAMPGFRIADKGQQKAQRAQAQQKLQQALAQAESIRSKEQVLKDEGDQQGAGSGKGKGAGDPSPDKGQGASLNPQGQRSPDGKSPDLSTDPSHNGQGPGIPSSSQQGSGANPTPATPAQMAQQQSDLAQKAQDLANALNQEAQSNASIGHGLGQKMQQAANQMNAAAQALKRGDHVSTPPVSELQESSIVMLDDILEILKNTIAADEHGTSSDDESIPPEYADQLSRYFQKLSHEK